MCRALNLKATHSAVSISPGSSHLMCSGYRSQKPRSPLPVSMWRSGWGRASLVAGGVVAVGLLLPPRRDKTGVQGSSRGAVMGISGGGNSCHRQVLGLVALVSNSQLASDLEVCVCGVRVGKLARFWLLVPRYTYKRPTKTQKKMG